jgi:hypothetical protein
MLRYLLAFGPEWLWYDEAFSVLTARLPLPDLITATVADVHPPLYYVALKLWLWAFDRGMLHVEAAARTLSLLCSGVALWLFWRVLHRLEMPEDQRRLAFTLAMYSPALIFFSADARMYPLMQVLILATLLQWLQDPVTWGAVIRAGLFMGLLALTHNAGLYYNAALAITAVIIHRKRIGDKRILKAVGAAAGIAFVVWLPWLPGLIRQVSERAGGAYWIGTPKLTNGLYAVYKSIFAMKYEPQALWPLVIVLVGAVTFWGYWLEDKRRWLPVLAFGPLVIGFSVSALLGAGAIIPRVVVPGTFFTFIAWAAVLRRRDVGYALIPVVVAVLMINNVQFVIKLPQAWPVTRHVADYRFLSIADYDLIYGSNTGILPLMLYADRPVYAADVPDFVGAGLTDQTEQALGMQKDGLHKLDWDRALLVFNTDGVLESPEEQIYAWSLVNQYGGQRLASPDVDPGDAYLWLLTRSASLPTYCQAR